MEALDRWIERQYRHAARAMLRSVSPVDIVKTRPGFGQTVRPLRGAIVASPVLASWDPEPDYFFHWFRDSAVVIDALRLLFEDGSLGEEALGHLHDFVGFSLSLQRLDGAALGAAPEWRTRVAEDFRRFVRDEGELCAVRGENVAAETRVNPDATLDISRWHRPQHDGPPLTALALLRWSAHVPTDTRAGTALAQLIRSLLDFTLRHARTPSYDIWEEEQGLHYHTLRVSAAALEQGAAWLGARGEPAAAQACRDEAAAILQLLDGYWLPAAGHYRSRVQSSGERSAKELDIAVILAAVHAGGGPHGADDPRMQATLARLEALFDAAYAINRERPPERGPAMGRYAGDRYFSGGAYFFSTLGAAEFCFRAAASAPDARAWAARGDAYLATVRAYATPEGDLSEQFDQTSGEQTSARHLAWSYAAFISCVAARRALAPAALR